jgi:hypothetical protein
MSNTTPPGPGGPEFLESSAGSPVAPSEHSSDNRKRLLVLGGLVGVLAVGGGAVWAASSFLGTGAQPAEAMPASTLGYVSIDLDPSGGQKIEAIRTLRKFPAFKEQIGLEADDDIREKIVEEIVKSGECEGLDYAEDVEPWLGDRAAVGAADLGGDTPVPILVVQVKDAGQAEDGLANLLEVCGDPAAESDDSGGYVVAGDWIVVSKSEADAQKVVDATEVGSLADDEDFKTWTGEAGDPGIVSMYAAPEAAQFVGRYLDDMGGMGSMFGMPSAYPARMELNRETGEFEETTPAQEPTIPPELQERLDEFKGAAATMRFNDGSLEVEFAGNAGTTSSALLGSEGGADGVADLPDDTMAAFGMGFADGWFQTMLDQMAASSGESPEEFLTMMSEETGLDLPADAETLLGEAVTISLGGDFDPEAAFNGGPEDVPVGITIEGDPAEIETVLDKLRPQMGDDASLLETESDDDSVILSPDADYRAALLEGGSLGDSPAYKSVVEGADDADVVLFVNFDAGDWLVHLGNDDPEAAANLEPLSAFGIAAWRDGDVSHSVLRLTTN